MVGGQVQAARGKSVKVRIGVAVTLDALAAENRLHVFDESDGWLDCVPVQPDLGWRMPHGHDVRCFCRSALAHRVATDAAAILARLDPQPGPLVGQHDAVLPDGLEVKWRVCRRFKIEGPVGVDRNFAQDALHLVHAVDADLGVTSGRAWKTFQNAKRFDLTGRYLGQAV